MEAVEYKDRHLQESDNACSISFDDEFEILSAIRTIMRSLMTKLVCRMLTEFTNLLVLVKEFSISLFEIDHLYR